MGNGNHSVSPLSSPLFHTHTHMYAHTRVHTHVHTHLLHQVVHASMSEEALDVYMCTLYGVAPVSSIDKVIGLFCKRAL